MKTMRTILVGAIGVLLGISLSLLVAPVAKCALKYFGPPRVTLVNATGADIASAIITLGSAEKRIAGLKDGQSVTVSVRGRFSECATHVTWTDAAGEHGAYADDYMENYGFYHTTVVLTPDRKARAIYEVQECQPATAAGHR